MNGRTKLLRRTVSVWMSALLLSLSIAVPLMERADVLRELLVETQHEPGSCPHAHDHTVCAQVGGNLSAASVLPLHRQSDGLVEIDAPTAPLVGFSSVFADGHPSRAPPLA